MNPKAGAMEAASEAWQERLNGSLSQPSHFMDYVLTGFTTRSDGGELLPARG